MSKIYTTVWRSRCLNQKFLITQHERVTLPALQKDGMEDKSVFTGYPASREDGCMALVSLTEKPVDYPYDFVLI